MRLVLTLGTDFPVTMSTTPTFTVAQPPSSEKETPIVRLPPSSGSAAKEKSPSRPPTSPPPIEDLESQLRGMLMSNGIATQPQTQRGEGTLSSRVPPHLRLAPLAEQQEYILKHQNDAAAQNLVGGALRPDMKINQAERKKQNGEISLPAVPTSNVTTSTIKSQSSNPNGAPKPSQSTYQSSQKSNNHAPRNDESWATPSAIAFSRMNHPQPRQSPQRQFPQHGRGSGQLHIEGGPVPNLSAGSFHPRQTYMNHRTQKTQRALHQYPDRPPPGSFHERPAPSQHRQLFDPNRNGPNESFPNRGPPPRNPGRFAPFNAQVDFLNHLADVEIVKAEIIREDLQAKEKLRLCLEEICRLTITKFEQTEDPHFDSGTVTLQCFGSLSSGFATIGSDMDLALISPASKPDAASMESKIPRLLEQALLDLGYGARLLTKARVPIIKFCERPTLELSEALMKERLRWEKIKDLPPKPKRVKKETDSQLPDPLSGILPDPTLPQNRPNAIPSSPLPKKTKKGINSRPQASKSKSLLDPDLIQSRLDAPLPSSVTAHTNSLSIPTNPKSSQIKPPKDLEVEKKPSKKRHANKAKAMNVGQFLKSQDSGNKAISEAAAKKSQASQLADNRLKLNSKPHVDKTKAEATIPNKVLMTGSLLANGVDGEAAVKSAEDAQAHEDQAYSKTEDSHGAPAPGDIKIKVVVIADDGEDEAANDNDNEVLVNGEGTESTPPIRSDEELVRLYKLAISEGWFETDERKIIYTFADAVKMSRSPRNESKLADARAALKSLPDVLKRYRDITDNPLDFPKVGVGIQSDINFSNLLALHNTLLLRCYSHCDARIRPMVLFVKAWAKQRKINSPYQGTLSSYGYVLMVLHFAVNIAEPPLAPNLQLAPRAFLPASNLEETICDGYNVRFWRSEKEICDCVARGTLLMHPQNREPLGSLLRSFFQYFAHQGQNVIGCGFSWTLDVLSLRSPGGLLTKKEKDWTGAKIVITEPTVPGQQSKEVRHRYLFAIEDPFEIDHNIARTVVHNGIVAIRDEFRRANRIIQNAGFDGGLPVNLFEEGKDPPSQRTFFGPKPRPEFGPKNLAMELRPVVAEEPGASVAVKSDPGQDLDTDLSVDVNGVAMGDGDEVTKTKDVGHDDTTGDVDGVTMDDVDAATMDNVDAVSIDNFDGVTTDTVAKITQSDADGVAKDDVDGITAGKVNEPKTMTPPMDDIDGS